MRLKESVNLKFAVQRYQLCMYSVLVYFIQYTVESLNSRIPNFSIYRPPYTLVLLYSTVPLSTLQFTTYIVHTLIPVNYLVAVTK